MNAVAEGLRWLGALLASAADELEAPGIEPAPWDGAPAGAAEEQLREMRGRYY